MSSTKRTTDCVADLAPRFSGRLLTAQEDMAPFLTDWRKMWRGRACAVAMPDTPQDVAAIVTWCAERDIPMVPQGGNTGLAGGATPDESGTALVLSLKRLNRIREIDTANAAITADAGCILADLQRAADAEGMYFPLSLAAEGSCTIGGNLATNAGGTNVLRYGNARALCLGIEIVTATGALWNGLRSLRKDNSGYDLRDLMIGAEGTLGIITGAVLKLFPKPGARVTALLAVDTPAQCCAAFAAASSALGQALSGAEFFAATCLDMVLAHTPAQRSPFATRHPWHLLLEAAAVDDEPALRTRLEAVLMTLLADGTAMDGLVAQSAAQAASLWSLRESISDSQAAAGPTIKHDIAVPLSAIPDFLREAEAAVDAACPGLVFVTFGHIGDGNIHYNLSPAPGAAGDGFHALQPRLNTIVHDIVLRHGGSISAEHGLACCAMWKPPAPGRQWKPR